MLLCACLWHSTTKQIGVDGTGVVQDCWAPSELHRYVGSFWVRTPSAQCMYWAFDTCTKPTFWHWHLSLCLLCQRGRLAEVMQSTSCSRLSPDFDGRPDARAIWYRSFWLKVSSQSYSISGGGVEKVALHQQQVGQPMHMAGTCLLVFF